MIHASIILIYTLKNERKKQTDTNCIRNAAIQSLLAIPGEWGEEVEGLLSGKGSSISRCY